MPLYSIRRDVGPISQEELDAASFRALVCAPQFPGLKWHRSFWDAERGRVDCVYEALNQHDIEQHARVARIPCDEVRPVNELLPDGYLNG